MTVFRYQKSLNQEKKEKNITRNRSLELLEQMITIRVFKEMLVKIVEDVYRTLPGFTYIGPIYLSIEQEAT